jgi:hypothetical protein
MRRAPSVFCFKPSNFALAAGRRPKLARVRRRYSAHNACRRSASTPLDCAGAWDAACGSAWPPPGRFPTAVGPSSDRVTAGTWDVLRGCMHATVPGSTRVRRACSVPTS